MIWNGIQLPEKSVYVRGGCANCANPVNSLIFVLTKCNTICKLIMKFIEHAFERFQERSFTPEMAMKLINGKRLLMCSKSNPNRYFAIGMVDGECWTVVLEKDLYTVVTARRAHKDEEELWKNSR